MSFPFWRHYLQRQASLSSASYIVIYCYVHVFQKIDKHLLKSHSQFIFIEALFMPSFPFQKKVLYFAHAYFYTQKPLLASDFIFPLSFIFILGVFSFFFSQKSSSFIKCRCTSRGAKQPLQNKRTTTDNYQPGDMTAVVKNISRGKANILVRGSLCSATLSHHHPSPQGKKRNLVCSAEGKAKEDRKWHSTTQNNILVERDLIWELLTGE